MVNDIEDNIVKYFNEGLTYVEILEFLRVQHQHEMSLSTLKRWLRKRGLKRRALLNSRCSYISVFNAVQTELYGSASDVGYRRMHKIMLNKGYICRRDDVRKILLQLDPDGVQLRGKRRLRRRKYHAAGPNFVWHIDGHDK